MSQEAVKSDEEWTPWIMGLEAPVGMVEVKYRNGETDLDHASSFYWGQRWSPLEIVAYRVVGKDELLTMPFEGKHINSPNDPLARFDKEETSNKYLRPCPYDTIDIYRVLQVYEVTDPCIQHAVKKLLCAGKRGYKEVEKDVEEAIMSLQRWEEMRLEEAQATTS